MKTVYILRGIPGNGKNYVADQLCDNSAKSTAVCCADDYLVDENGVYKWSQDTIGSAHKWCQLFFEENLKDETDIIVIANTNVHSRDVRFYRDMAITYGYAVIVLTIENWHDGNDSHNVTKELKHKMASILKQNLKLLPDHLQQTTT